MDILYYVTISFLPKINNDCTYIRQFCRARSQITSRAEKIKFAFTRHLRSCFTKRNVWDTIINYNLDDVTISSSILRNIIYKHTAYLNLDNTFFTLNLRCNMLSYYLIILWCWREDYYCLSIRDLSRILLSIYFQ